MPEQNNGEDDDSKDKSAFETGHGRIVDLKEAKKFKNELNPSVRKPTITTRQAASHILQDLSEKVEAPDKHFYEHMNETKNVADMANLLLACQYITNPHFRQAPEDEIRREFYRKRNELKAKYNPPK